MCVYVCVCDVCVSVCVCVLGGYRDSAFPRSSARTASFHLFYTSSIGSICLKKGSSGLVQFS